MSSSRRFFFVDFFKNRDWDSVAKFWHNNVRSPSPLVTGNKKYGITDLKTLECNSNQQTNYSRFALRVGYCGTMYTSYPRNLGRDTEGQVRVENDIDAALGKEAYCSRMTNPNASAISQIVSVSGSSNDTAAAILEKARRCLPVGLGRLAIYDCVRVMDSFHAREQATWRRYLYLFPLNEGEHDGVDIDVDFVNDALKR